MNTAGFTAGRDSLNVTLNQGHDIVSAIVAAGLDKGKQVALFANETSNQGTGSFMCPETSTQDNGTAPWVDTTQDLTTLGADPAVDRLYLQVWIEDRQDYYKVGGIIDLGSGLVGFGKRNRRFRVPIPQPTRKRERVNTLADRGFLRFKKQQLKGLVRLRLDGMPQSELTEKLQALETLRESLSWFDRLRGADIKILSDEVALLALGYAELQNAQNADAIQADKFRDFIKVSGDPNTFCRFMSDQFKNDWIELRSEGKQYFEIAEYLLMKYTNKL